MPRLKTVRYFRGFIYVFLTADYADYSDGRQLLPAHFFIGAIRVIRGSFFRQLHCELDGGDHAVRSRDSFARDLKSRAMIRTGTRERKPEGDVHSFMEGMQLQWNETLIVIHAEHRVPFAGDCAVENGVGRKGAGEEE